ncbi:MAG: FixH family protein [Polyangiaceae bacterium]
MFRARVLASLLLPLAGLFCACSSNSSSNPASAGNSGDAPSGNVGCSQMSGDAYLPGMQKLGDAGRYSFALLSSTPAPPALNDNTFILQVSDASGQAVPGELSVALDMPEHGHSSPTEPTIVLDPDTNQFTLDPMNLFMVGLWRLTFSFQPASGGAEQADSAVFKFCID